MAKPKGRSSYGGAHEIGRLLQDAIYARGRVFKNLLDLEVHLVEFRSNNRFDDPVVQRDFAVAQAKDPSLTKDAFLRRELLKESSPAIIRLLWRFGPDGVTLMSSNSPKELFRVYAGMVSATKYRHFECDGGVRFQSVIDRLDAQTQLELRALMVKAGLPVPMGMIRAKGGLPSWSDGRAQFWSNFGYAVCNRLRKAAGSNETAFRIGTFKDMVGGKPHQIPVEELHAPGHGMLDHADCSITLHDGLMMSKGFTPIYGGAVLRKGPARKPVPPRQHYELLLQLAFLTKDPTWLGLGGKALSNKIRDLRAGPKKNAKPVIPDPPPSNPHLTLSAEDCASMLMGEDKAPRVDFESMEIEHELGQRVGGVMERFARWVGADAPKTSALSHLSGVLDPANTRAVSPVQHFMVDGFAAYFFRPLLKGVLAPSSKRLGLMRKTNPDGTTSKAPIPGRPYFAVDDLRKPQDIIGKIEEAVEQKKSLADAATQQRLPSDAHLQRVRNTFEAVAARLREIDERIKGGEKVPMDEILDAVLHKGGDRVKNPFVAMDAGKLVDLMGVLRTLDPKAAPEGYPRLEALHLYRSVIEAARKYNLPETLIREVEARL